MSRSIVYRRTIVDDLEIAYREAGPSDAPALLLLHGFPSAGHMFRELIPELADRFRIVAPDLPGFGQSTMPLDGSFEYTFANLASVTERFTEVLGLKSFAIYIFDYGAPVGLRLALWNPNRITAIISQNGNAYEEGLSKGWDSLREYWRRPTDVSPILANLFLHYAFDRWMKENNPVRSSATLMMPSVTVAVRRKRFHCGRRWKRGLRRVSWNCIRKRRRLCTAKTRTDRTVIRSNASIFWALRFDPDNR